MSGGSWKVAYADFVTAMMAFFLLMWILGMVPKDKQAEIAGYFKDPGGYGSQSTVIDFTNPPSPSVSVAADSKGVEKISEGAAANIEIHKYIADMAASKNIAKDIAISSSELGVQIRTTNQLIFAPNSAELPEEGKALLDTVIDVMKSFKVNLIIRGHTDPDETGAPQFKSKWELAAARAAAATAYIVENGHINPSQLMSASYADTRPIAINAAGQPPSPENRRVEFFFHRPDVQLNSMGYSARGQ